LLSYRQEPEISYTWVMKFRINIGAGRTNIRLSVERIHLDERIERFKVTGRNGSIVIESNRQLFRNKGLKHRRADWKQIEGKNISTHSLEKICAEILKHLD
jgi:hypothetical protein